MSSHRSESDRLLVRLLHTLSHNRFTAGLVRARRRPFRSAVTAVLAVVLAVGGGTFAVYTYLTQRGAASPDEVMSTVSQAIADKDIISMFKMVSPSEIDTVADSADAIRDGGSDSRKGSSKADPGALLSKDAINNYLEALDVSSSEMTYSVDQKSDDLAIATISSWHLDVRVDQSLADSCARATSRPRDRP